MHFTLDLDRLPRSHRQLLTSVFIDGTADSAVIPSISDGTLRVAVPDDQVLFFAQHGLPVIREAIAASPRLRTATAEILARDADAHVLLALAINARTPGTALARIRTNPAANDLIRQLIALHPHAPKTPA